MNELKITDVVDQKAFEQLERLKSELDSTFAAYKKAGDAMAEGLKIKPGPYSELISKAKDYYAAIEKVYALEDKIKRIQEEQKNVLLNLNAEAQKRVKNILDEATAELKVQKAKTEELKQQKMLNQERKKTKYTIEEGIAALNMEVKTMKDAEEQNKILRSARKQLDLTTEEGRKTVERFNSVIDRNTTFLKKNSDQLVQAKMNVGRYKQDIQSAASEILKGNISLKNMGNLAKSTGGLLKSSMGAGFTEVRVGVGSMIKGMIGAQAVISGFQKFIGLFKSGVQSIVDFEAANSKLAAILGTTSNNIKDLTLDAQRLGSATKYTASEATNLQIELAKLGFSRKEILQSTEGILKFAQATGSDLPEAAALAGAALRMFGAETSETERYVSAMAVATTKSALSFSYLQTAMPIVGPVAKAFNFQIEDTLALLGKLADAGFDASMSATATRNILLNLADGSGELAKALGGPVNTLPELVAGLKKLKAQGVDLNTTLELTDKRSVAAFNAFLTAADKIVPLREQITGVTSELNDMASTMGDNVQGAIAGLSSAWEAFMLSFMNSTGPAKSFLDFLAKGIRNIAHELKDNNQLQEEANNKAIASAQSEMSKSDILEKNAKNMQRLYQEYINSGMSADKAAQKAKEDYIETLKSRLEYENTDYQLAIDNRKKLEEELKDRGLFTILTSWKRTNNVIRDEIDVATKAAAGKKAISSITESLIEQLKNVSLTADEKKKEGNGGETNLSAEEKQRKERIRIQQEYQQSELDLMDEGLGKELAKIRLNYTKRIAAVKGNTQEEIKTRENLAVAMEDELSEKIYTYNQNKEKINLQNRLEALSTNSKEELDQRLSIQLQVNEILLNSAT